MKRFIIAIAATIALPGSVFAQPAPAPIFTSGSNSDSASSWVAGGRAGYNWQGGAWVYGLEADISAMHLNTDMNTILPFSVPIPPLTANTNAEVDWYGTLRGRLGWSSGPVLFYGTGGLAYGRVELNSSISASPLFLSSQTSSVKVGWVAGGGIEYMWRPDVILNIGYQYVDLGTVSLASSTAGFGGTLSQSASAHAQFHVATIGLNWKFAPSGSKPWEGGYAGGHIGGTWGNRTNAAYSGSTLPIAENCFTEITQVLMADGTTRSISEVIVGDEVLGENGNVNKVVDIEIHFLGGRKLYAFNDGLAFVTPEHPFMTRAGWKSMAPEATLAETGNFSVGALKVGDEVVRLEAVKKRGKPIAVAGNLVPTPSVEVLVETEFSELKSITPHDGDPSMTVYNLKLDGNHTYFANNYLTHNK
jgi:outer membrane immunogenic protein